MHRLIEALLKVGMLAAAGCFIASDAAMAQRISTQAESSFKSVMAPSTSKTRPTFALPLPRDLQSPCADAREHALPLPTTVPPKAFVQFESQVLAFLKSAQYRQLGWCRDKGSEHSPIRDTGPFSKGVYYGTHPAVRIYYSPRAMKWLIDGRQGPVPDGAMIIKEQYQPPAARYSGLSDEQLPQATDWTVMIKDSAGAKDGWLWGEFFDGMKFDDDKPPFQYPWASFGLYCLRCHATAEKEHTFSALDNIQGFPGQPIEFPDDGSWRGQPIAKAMHANSSAHASASKPRDPVWEFLRTFTSIPGVVLPDVEKMPSETYDHVVAPAAEGQYISSSVCMSCHGALNGPFGPTMFLPSPSAPIGTVAGANVSPYGEWRWSPMGLAGRDPIFFAQVEGELAYLDTLPFPQSAEQKTGLTNACMSCHGAMGKKQLDIDAGGHGDFKLAFLQLTDRSNPDFLYGALARDGISCAVCHRIVPDYPPVGASPLEYFLTNSMTGRFASSSPDMVFGPHRDNEISPYTMANAVGITPKNSEYVKSSRMCGSCHTIDLPVVDGKPGETSLEQVTYLEWLNSGYQNE